MNKWIQTKLGDIVSDGGGVIQTGPFGSQLHASDYVEKGIPCIMPINLKDNRIILDAIANISPADASRLSKHLVEEDDIIYSRRGDITKKALITKEEVGFFCGTGCLLIRPGSKINSKFLLYVLEKPENISWLKNHAVGITMPNINTKILSSIPLDLPPRNYQDKVATVLGVLDAKIQLNNRINTELEQMAQMLYNYWFVQFDFPNAQGKPYKSSAGKMLYNEELKRVIPAGWGLKKLGDFVSSINTGLNPRDHFKLGDGQNYYITIKNIEYGRIIINSSCDKINDDALARIQQRSRLEKGDILFTSIEPVGKTFLLLENPKNWNINESVFSFKPDYNVVTSEYLFMLLSSEEVKLKCKNASTGSIHKGIRITPLKEFTFAYPPIETINSFTKLISPILEKINLAQKQNQQLSSLRDWLLPMLMNGQVKVGSSDMSTKEGASIVAEPVGKIVPLAIPANKKGFAKQVLAGKIVSKFIDDQSFTDIKFQKVQFLAEHIVEADLNLNYYCQAAGPYDNKFMHTIYNDFHKQKWFDFKNKRFIPLEKKEKIEDYYRGYFAPVQKQLNKLFNLLYPTSEAEAEIIATLYAVWNNRIIEGRTTGDGELIKEFYQWSDRKQQYTKGQVTTGLKWLRKHQMEPKGFGKLIKKAKAKS
jgi:type I restriction enzyme, S subunit